MISFARRFWLEIRLYTANRIVAKIPSHFFRLWFYRVVMKAKIGSGSSIFMDAWLDTPGGLRIGLNTTVNAHCRLDARGGLTIGDNVSISESVLILTADHDVQSVLFDGRTSPVSIGDFVFIGTRAMILPGVTLGDGCVVAAGSVVTNNVPAFAIVAGIPAKRIGNRSPDLQYTVRYRRLFQ